MNFESTRLAIAVLDLLSRASDFQLVSCRSVLLRTGTQKKLSPIESEDAPQKLSNRLFFMAE